MITDSTTPPSANAYVTFFVPSLATLIESKLKSPLNDAKSCIFFRNFADIDDDMSSISLQ